MIRLITTVSSLLNAQTPSSFEIGWDKRMKYIPHSLGNFVITLCRIYIEQNKLQSDL